MAKKKLGMSTIEINKKFASREQAYKYAKRLKEFIRYTCKKNASKGWYGQAMIITSNTSPKVVSRVYYERTGKVGRPKIKRCINTSGWYKEVNTDWHIHMVLVSEPTKAFAKEIKDYVDRNWIEVQNAKMVYKKDCNIGLAEYLFLQSESRLYCNYNCKGKIPYTLKQLFQAYMKIETTKKYDGRSYWSDEEKQVNNEYRKIIKYYWSLTKEEDKKDSDRFIKMIQNSKIAESKEKKKNNKVQKDVSIRRTSKVFDYQYY